MVSVGDAIKILITGDGTQAVNEFKKVGASADANLKKADGSGKNLSNTLTKTGVAAVGAGLVIGAGLFKAAQAASEADLAQQKLLNTIKNSPALAGASTEAFNKQADALEKTTINSHIATTTVQAMLGQFKLTQAQILEATPFVEDFANKFGIDLTAAAKAVGKSFEGSGGGLKRYGIIADVSKTSTHNFATTIDALRGTVGGFAAQEGKTFSGQIEIMKNELKHTEEQIGAGAIPVIRQLAGVVGTAAGGFVHLNDATGGTVGSVLAYGSAALIVGGSLAVVAGKAKDAAVAMKLLAISEEEGAGASLTAAGALTGFGAVALIAAGTIQHFHQSTLDASAGADTLKAALHSTADQMSDAADTAAADYISKHQGVAKALKDAGLSTLQFSSALKGNKIAAREVGDALKGANLGRHSVEIGILAARTQDAEKQNERYNTALAETKVKTKDATSATSDLTSKLADQGAAAKVDADHLYDIVGATNKLHDAQRGATGAVLDYKDAALTALGAQSDYNAAVKQYGPNSAQALVAAEALTRAQLALGSAQDTARQSALDAAKAVAGGSTKTEAFVHALIAEKAQYPELAAWIDVYLGRLHTIPTDINTQVKINGQTANIGSNGTIQLPGQNGGRSIKYGAKGNTFGSGDWGVVGEEGPELIHFGGGARVFSHERSKQMIRGARSGGSSGSPGGGDVYIDHITVVANSPREMFDQITRGVNDGHRIPAKAIA